MKHIVITPVFNEAEHLPVFLDSVLKQTLPPDLLLLVDDNSTDRSADIIKEYADNHDFIFYLYHPSSPKKVQGSKVIEAFNFGLKHVDLQNVSFISKLDADLELPFDYFDAVIKVFEKFPDVGIAGGRIKEYHNNEWRVMRQSDYSVRGALKTYRKSCFDDIGGLMPVLGWDGLDTMKAFYNGWKTHIPDCTVKHFRPASKDYLPVKMHYKYGVAHYKNGRSFFLALVRAAVRLKDKPFLLSSASYMAGYVVSFLKREKKNVDTDLARFINAFHIRRLYRMKR